MSASIFQQVNDDLIADIERGAPPWRPSWDRNAFSPFTLPKRHNGELYQGINTWWLLSAGRKKGFRNPTWMSYLQAKEYGGQVREGEKGSPIIFAKRLVTTETDQRSGEEKERFVAMWKTFKVFNVEQIDGLPERFQLPVVPAFPKPEVQRITELEEFFKNTGIEIRHGGGEAYYTESADYVQMPPIEAFNSREAYYSTLSHESTHATKHSTRLARNFGGGGYGSDAYAMEELVAELGAAYLSAELGIATPEVREDHASYIGQWLKAMKQDNKYIFTASSHAMKAVEFLKSKQPEVVLEQRPEIQPTSRALVLTC